MQENLRHRSVDGEKASDEQVPIASSADVKKDK